MERSHICTFWVLVIIFNGFLSAVVTAEKGTEIHQPGDKTGIHNQLTRKSQQNARQNIRPSHDKYARQPSKKGIIQAFEDPVETVTVTETQYVTATVTPVDKQCLTTTEMVTQCLTTLTVAPTTTQIATTQTTDFVTATTVQVTPTCTKTETVVTSIEATSTLTTQTVLVETTTKHVVATDSTTVYVTLTASHTAMTTAVATQTVTPVILINPQNQPIQDKPKTGSESARDESQESNKKSRDYISHQRYRRVRRSWYTELIPKFVKKWMGMEGTKSPTNKA